MKRNLEKLIYLSIITVIVCMVLIGGYIGIRGIQIEAYNQQEVVVSNEVAKLLKIERRVSEKERPEFVEKDLKEFEAWAAENDVDYTIEYEYSDEIKENQIIILHSKDGDEDVVVVVVSKGIDYNLEVTLPNLSGMTVEAIQEFVRKNHLTGVTYNYVSDDYIEAGRFISISVNKSTVKRNEKIVITISLGKKEVIVTVDNRINVIDFSAMSKTEIDNWGVKNRINIVYVNVHNNSVIKDGFISQSIAKGTKIDPSSTITITLSLGKPNIPSFVGSDVSSANSSLSTINGAGGNISIIVSSQEYSSTVELNRIISQSIVGTADVGTIVSVVVSLGPPPTTDVMVGDYVGMTYENASNAIIGSSLGVSNNDGSCNTDSIVIEQSVGSSVLVPINTTIDLKCDIDSP